MTAPNPVASKRKYYTVEEANRALPLVRAIVGDIVKQLEIVDGLRQRLSSLSRDRKKAVNDVYHEEIAQFEAEIERHEAELATYRDELMKLGVELKSHDGLCDFYSLRDGREIYLCWRLGEDKVAHWHELADGFAGRQPIDRQTLATGNPRTDRLKP